MFQAKGQSPEPTNPGRSTLNRDQTNRPFNPEQPITSRTSNMELTEAADAIREKLIEHRMSRTTNLWSTILKQIRKQDAFDGQYADTILEIIRSFLSQLYAFRKFHAPLEIYGGLQTVLIVSVSSRTAHRLLTASSCNAS